MRTSNKIEHRPGRGCCERVLSDSIYDCVKFLSTKRPTDSYLYINCDNPENVAETSRSKDKGRPAETGYGSCR